MMEASRSKADMAYATIKSMILDGEITSESLISEEAFSRGIELGRTPVREAIKRLIYEGYFQKTPQGGVVLHKASLRECRELYDLRFALEEYVMSGIPLPLGKSVSDSLDEMLCQQKQVVSLSKTSDFLPLDIRFHVFIFELYGNTIFTNFYQELRNKFIAVGLVVFNEEYTIGTAYREHCGIVEALKSGNNADAVASARSHILHAQKQLFSGGALGKR
jgi:DNA-binding GntR family transcriptional regulator